jgi:hypothetical protein
MGSGRCGKCGGGPDADGARQGAADELTSLHGVRLSLKVSQKEMTNRLVICDSFIV